ncbi:MAG TPA: hypothetical protein VHZ99_12055 [Steroidobacteraceae bacterium]|jgi:hypothetical protein|nr:hypothetical protein [Steroidobacteraceae bacterium]
MNQLPAPLAILSGMIVGASFGLFLSHWLRLLLTSLGKHPRLEKPPVHTSRVGPAVFAILHPAPWLVIIGVLVGIYKFTHGPVAAQWLWFWAGAAITVIGTYSLAIQALRRIQRRQIQALNR